MISYQIMCNIKIMKCTWEYELNIIQNIILTEEKMHL